MNVKEFFCIPYLKIEMILQLSRSGTQIYRNIYLEICQDFFFFFQILKSCELPSLLGNVWCESAKENKVHQLCNLSCHFVQIVCRRGWYLLRIRRETQSEMVIGQLSQNSPQTASSLKSHKTWHSWEIIKFARDISRSPHIHVTPQAISEIWVLWSNGLFIGI